MTRIALVSLSNNYDMQEYLYSLYEDMKKVHGQVITIGSSHIITDVKVTDDNYLFKVPHRPGIEARTFHVPQFYKILKVLKKVDLVYFISAHVWNLALIKLLKNKVRLVHTIHDPFPHENEKHTDNVAKYNRFICNHIQDVIMHNRTYEERFRSYYHYKGNLYYAPLWRKWRDFVEKDHPSDNILFFGRVNPYKGIQYMATLAKNLSTYSFHILGRFSDEAVSYKEELKALDNVDMRDAYVEQGEMEEAFREADVIILPYLSATQSGVVVDAYRASKSIIAFHVGALGEQVEEGVSGYLVEAGDTQGFVDAIRSFMNLDQQARRKLAYGAWELGKNMFSTHQIIQVLEKVKEVDHI